MEDRWVAVIDQELESWSVDKFHHQIGLSLIGNSVFVGLDDVGVFHLEGDFSLTGFSEAFEAVFEELDLLGVTKFHSDDSLIVIPVFGYKEVAHGAGNGRAEAVESHFDVDARLLPEESLNFLDESHVRSQGEKSDGVTLPLSLEGSEKETSEADGSSNRGGVRGSLKRGGG